MSDDAHRPDLEKVKPAPPEDLPSGQVWDNIPSTYDQNRRIENEANSLYPKKWALSIQLQEVGPMKALLRKLITRFVLTDEFQEELVKSINKQVDIPLLDEEDEAILFNTIYDAVQAATNGALNKVLK